MRPSKMEFLAALKETVDDMVREGLLERRVDESGHETFRFTEKGKAEAAKFKEARDA